MLKVRSLPVSEIMQNVHFISKSVHPSVLECLGFQPLWARNFSYPIQTRPGAQTASWVPAGFPGLKRSGLGVDNPSLLVPRLCMVMIYFANSSTRTILASYRVTFTFTCLGSPERKGSFEIASQRARAE